MDDTYSIKLEDLAEGEQQVVAKRNGGLYAFSMSDWDSMREGKEEIAEYDLRRIENAFSLMLENESKTFITSLDQLQELAKNPQFDKKKVKEINDLVSYYINKDMFLGKAYGVLENNINTDYRVIYPREVPEKKGKKKKVTSKDTDILESAKKITEDFLDKVDIRGFITNAILTTYSGGNFVCYLNGDVDGYLIDEYPLDLLEVTKIKVGGTNIVSLDVKELKARIEKEYKKYSSLKSVSFMDIKRDIKSLIAEDYPLEVSDAVGKNDKVALLNPERTGLSRIGNLKGQYGLTPLFKSLKSLLLLEQMDSSDSKTLMSKNKKIIFQKLRRELLDKKVDKTLYTSQVKYSHGALLESMSEEIVVYTGQPYVEGLEIIEPKTELTNPQNISQCKSDIINSVGINYTINEGKGGVASSKYSYEDLLKTINNIAKNQVEPIINKFIQVVMVDNGFDPNLAPKFEIQLTSIKDLEELVKICELYRNKLNLSYETVLETMGLDVNDEIAKRLNENKFNGGEGIASVFYAYPTAFNSSGDDSIDSKEDDTTNKNGSKKSKNTDKSLEDKINNSV